jgi:putative FmdB family regulatory protein
MPLYEYDCLDCGPFDLWRSMAESSAAAPCKQCGAPAARVLSAVALGRGRGRPRPTVEPHLVKRNFDPPPAAKPSGGPAHAHDRPWMIGH